MMLIRYSFPNDKSFFFTDISRERLTHKFILFILNTRGSLIKFNISKLFQNDLQAN